MATHETIGASPIDRLIAALARKAVAEYLTRQAASEQATDAERTKRGQLPATRKAA